MRKEDLELIQERIKDLVNRESQWIKDCNELLSSMLKEGQVVDVREDCYVELTPKDSFEGYPERISKVKKQCDSVYVCTDYGDWYNVELMYGDLGYKELRCYIESYALKNYISFRWYDKRGNFECLFGYSNNVGLCGGFTKRADITDFINEIGIGRGWIKKVLDNATPNTPDYIIL